MYKSEFRNFVSKLYYEAMKERFLWRQKECTVKEWFTASKWWLRQRYREEEHGLD